MSSSIFSLTVEESIYFSDDLPKIEVVNSPQDKGAYAEQLSVINQFFLEAHHFHLEKDYQSSIEALKSAFYTTFEIKESSCLQYAEMFRSTIISSMENIHSDLKQMTTGWFKVKRLKSSFELATVVLDECRIKQ